MAATLILTMSASAGAQAWVSLYEEARQDIQKGLLDSARQKLDKVKSMGQQPGVRRLTANQIVNFFPDFHLGVIAMKQGRFKEALGYFEAAKIQGAPNRNTPDGDFRQLDTLLAAAKKELAATPTLNAENTTKPTVPDPNPPGRGETNPPGRGETPPVGRNAEVTPPPVVPAGPTPRDNFDKAMAEASSFLKANNYAAARTAAQSARSLNVDNSRADTMLTEIREAQGNSLARDIDAAIKAGDVTKARGALQSLATQVPDFSRTADYRTRVDNLATQVFMSRTEREAMTAYFAGNYSAVIKVVSDAAGTVPQLSPRALLYRACSMAALALQSKTPDQARINSARASMGTGISPTQFQSDLRYISPKIREALKLGAT